MGSSKTGSAVRRIATRATVVALLASSAQAQTISPDSKWSKNQPLSGQIENRNSHSESRPTNAQIEAQIGMGWDRAAEAFMSVLPLGQIPPKPRFRFRAMTEAKAEEIQQSFEGEIAGWGNLLLNPHSGKRMTFFYLNQNQAPDSVGYPDLYEATAAGNLMFVEAVHKSVRASLGISDGAAASLIVRSTMGTPRNDVETPTSDLVVAAYPFYLMGLQSYAKAYATGDWLAMRKTVDRSLGVGAEKEILSGSVSGEMCNTLIEKLSSSQLNEFATFLRGLGYELAKTHIWDSSQKFTTIGRARPDLIQ